VLIAAFIATPLAARAQVSCAANPVLVMGGSAKYFELMANRDFTIRKATIDDSGFMYILGDEMPAFPVGFSDPSDPYIVMCTPVGGMEFLEEKRLQDALNHTFGGAMAITFGTAGVSPAQSPAAAANFTSTTIVGFRDAGPFTPFHAFRWTEGGGVVDLGTLAPANNANRSSRATAVGAGGSVVVGYSDVSSGLAQHAFRWTAATGMVDLGVPAGDARSARAHDVSSDGTVIVGEAEFPDPQHFIGIRNSAFRWTQVGGFQNLGALQPG
jgi:probable HAF family extracellular repeat protein